jgi:hypothetical protein
MCLNEDKSDEIPDFGQPCTIYVIKCENNKYYVGRSNSFAKRYDMHLSGKGAYWTRIHKPIKVIERIDNADKYDEDKYVWKYMDKYGIDNVRGGSYSQVILSENSRKCAERHIQSGSDKCYHCGEGGHLLRDCQSRKRKHQDEIDKIENELQNEKKKDLEKEPAPEHEQEHEKEKEREYDLKFASGENQSMKKVKISKDGSVYLKCERCERYGHHISQCFAKRNRYGVYIGYS